MYKLSVPYVDRAEAKELGAKWNRELKTWFIPRVESWRKFKKWLTDEQISAIESYLNHKKAKRVTKLQNGAALLEMLDPFPNDSLED